MESLRQFCFALQFSSRARFFQRTPNQRSLQPPAQSSLPARLHRVPSPLPREHRCCMAPPSAQSPINQSAIFGSVTPPLASAVWIPISILRDHTPLIAAPASLASRFSAARWPLIPSIIYCTSSIISASPRAFSESAIFPPEIAGMDRWTAHRSSIWAAAPRAARSLQARPVAHCPAHNYFRIPPRLIRKEISGSASAKDRKSTRLNSSHV